MRFNDAITGCVLVVFAIAVIAYTQTFPSLHGQKYGPDLFPRIIGIALIVSGLILIVRGVVSKRRLATDFQSTDRNSQDSPRDGLRNSPQNSPQNSPPNSQWVEAGSWLQQSRLKINLLLVLLALIGYILFSDWLGFILSSMLILTVLLYRLGSSALVSILVAITTTALLQLTFAKLLLVPLPAGLLQGLVY